MKTRKLAMLSMVSLLVSSLCGCAGLLYREPENASLLPRYGDLETGELFKKVAYDNPEQLRGLRKVLVLPVKTALAVRFEWFNKEDRLESELASVITAAGTALREELAMHFVVLPHSSFADRDTIIVEAMITDLAPVNLSGADASFRKKMLPPRPYAAMEAVVRIPEQRESAIRIKDWRVGKQRTPTPVEGDDGHAGLLSIFYFWGDRMGQLIKAEAERSPATPDAESRGGLFFDIPDGE